MRESNIFPAVVLAIGGTLFLTLGWFRDRDDAWKWLAILFGAILLFFALLETVDWLLVHWGNTFSENLYRARAALAVTPESEMLRALSTLQPWQVDAWMRLGAPLVAVPTVTGSALYYEIEGEKIPVEFVQNFFANSTSTHLPLIRSYSDGVERDWAGRITKWCVSRGVAKEAAGNQGAKWVKRDEALKWFSLETG